MLPNPYTESDVAHLKFRDIENPLNARHGIELELYLHKKNKKHERALLSYASGISYI